MKALNFMPLLSASFLSASRTLADTFAVTITCFIGIFRIDVLLKIVKVILK